MPHTVPNSAPAHLKRIPILAVSSSVENRRSLNRILDTIGWAVTFSGTLNEAKSTLAAKPPKLILCDYELTDGCWKDVYYTAAKLNPSLPVVVVAPTSEQSLCAEAFNLGAFDMLLQPLDTGEVRRVVEMAFRRFETQAAA